MLFVVAVIVFVFSMFGCTTTKSYVDPQYGRAGYDDISRRSEPYKLKIAVEFQRNGKHLKQVDSELMGHVERVIRGSGFAVPATQGTSGELKVIVNNVADLKKAAAKGFGTGLTLGLAGSTVTDYYEMEAVLSLNGKVIKKTDYKHALHSTVGVKKAPEGLEPMTPSAAFGKIVEQLILNFLKDVQSSGEVSWMMNIWNLFAEIDLRFLL
jgi:hypothetical protein